MLIRLLLVLTVLSLSGCAGLGREPLAFRDPSIDAVWPSQPSQPRIRFLRELLDPEQIVPQQGKVDRLWELITGEKQTSLKFSTPYGIATNGGSLVYVADTSAGVVHRYDLNKRSVSYITDAGDEPLVSPVGVAVDAQGTLYVTDSVNGAVYLFSASGDYLRKLGDASHTFQRPAGIAVNRHGEIYVVDVLAQKLMVFRQDGHFIGYFPKEGSGEPLNLPSNVATDRNDRVYVTDSMNFKVKVYDRDGNFKNSIGEIGDSPGSFARPKGVAVDSDSHIYIVDATHDNFQIFDQDGSLLLFVGKTGKGPGEFYLPSGIYIDQLDRIFISDTYNHRIQIFQYLKEGGK